MSDRPRDSRWSIDEAELSRLTKEARQFKGESLWTDAWRWLRRNRAAFLALSRTLRGLSASADDAGIHAAKLFALLRASPEPAAPAASRSSAAGVRQPWLD